MDSPMRAIPGRRTRAVRAGAVHARAFVRTGSCRSDCGAPARFGCRLVVATTVIGAALNKAEGRARLSSPPREASRASAGSRLSIPILPAPAVVLNLTPETEASLFCAALIAASLLVVSLPFDHTAALRIILLSIAAGLTFASGGWRIVGELPLLVPWALWALVAGISVLFAHDPRASFGEFRNEVVYTFCAFATWFTLAGKREGILWLARALIVAIAAALIFGVVIYAPGRQWFDLGDLGEVGSLTTFLITAMPVL